MRVYVALQVEDDAGELVTFAREPFEIPDGRYAARATMVWALHGSNDALRGPLFDFAARGPRGVGIGMPESGS